MEIILIKPIASDDEGWVKTILEKQWWPWQRLWQDSAIIGKIRQ